MFLFIILPANSVSIELPLCPCLGLQKYALFRVQNFVRTTIYGEITVQGKRGMEVAVGEVSCWRVFFSYSWSSGLAK